MPLTSVSVEARRLDELFVPFASAVRPDSADDSGRAGQPGNSERVD